MNLPAIIRTWHYSLWLASLFRHLLHLPLHPSSPNSHFLCRTETHLISICDVESILFFRVRKCFDKICHTLGPGEIWIEWRRRMLINFWCPSMLSNTSYEDVNEVIEDSGNTSSEIDWIIYFSSEKRGWHVSELDCRRARTSELDTRIHPLDIAHSTSSYSPMLQALPHIFHLWINIHFTTNIYVERKFYEIVRACSQIT